MHVVTKILIVFGALLSVLLAALAMAFAANADAIQRSVGSEIERRTVSDTALAQERASSMSYRTELQARADAAENQYNQLANERKALDNEVAKLRADLQQAQLDAERFRNQAAGKDQVVQTNMKLVESLTTENQTLRERTMTGARRETELTERNAELESNVQVLQQNVRSLQEQLAETRGSAGGASTASASSMAAGSAASGFEGTGPLVSGRVRKITRAENGEDLAFITVGSSSGLRSGQRLSIVRDGKFVASIILTVVDASESAGRIDRLGRSVDVQENDLVLSRVN